MSDLPPKIFEGHRNILLTTGCLKHFQLILSNLSLGTFSIYVFPNTPPSNNEGCIQIIQETTLFAIQDNTLVSFLIVSFLV